MRTEAADRGSIDVAAEHPDTRLILNPALALKATNVMSNGQYSVMLTATGAGYSRFGDICVTRWQADPTEDRMGSFLFLRDAENGAWWSATAEPRRVEGETAQTHFSDGKASFVKTVGTIRSEVECIVVSEGNGEAQARSPSGTTATPTATSRSPRLPSWCWRRKTPTAPIRRSRRCSWRPRSAPTTASSIARRRTRSADEPVIELAHFVEDSSGSQRATEAETDRRAFLGRGRSIADPAALQPGARLTGSAGFVLDPVISLRRQVRVPARKKVSVTFWTVVGKARVEVEEAMSRLQHPESFARQTMLSWTRSQVQTRHVGLSLADAANVQRLARYLLYPDASMRQPAQALAAGLGPQSSLWPTSISGDFPIFALRIGDVADLEIVASTLRMQEYLRARGVIADLVIVNEQASSYVQDLQQAIEWLCENSRLRGSEHGPRQHIFAVRRDLMDERTYRTLLAAARIVLHTRNGPIFDQIERAESGELQPKLAAIAEALPEALPKIAQACRPCAAPSRPASPTAPASPSGTAMAASPKAAANMWCG